MSTGIISSVSLENTQGGKSTDRDYAQNELENLISLATAHKTREELATRLLARYLSLDQADKRWIDPEEYEHLQEEVFTAELWAARKADYDATLDNVRNLRDATERNAVQRIIYSDETYFGLEYIEKHLQVYRKGNSDLIRFIYTTTDAAICQQTLNELLVLFLEKHKTLKKGQSSEVAEFFAEATSKSAERLHGAEARLLQFRVQNKIINYDEETRSVAIRKQDLDELRFRENMDLEGVAATRQRVESELGNRSALREINEGLSSLREEMGQVSEQLAKIDITASDNDTPTSIARKRELEAREDELKTQMSRYVDQRYDFQYSTKGVQTESLLDEWLNTIITEEQSTARLAVIGQRTQEFADIYDQYAPLGSELNELQREIDLAEDEYLENLHSYNQAVLHQQNALMSTNLEMIDSPYLPIDQADYKRFLFLILGFMGGSFGVLALLIALAFLDESLKNPELVREKTGLEVATITPNFALSKRSKKARLKREAARQQAMALLLQQIKVETLQKDSNPKLVLVASTRREEGKSWIAQQVADLLRAEDNRVLYLRPEEEDTLPEHLGGDDLGYNMNSRMLDAEQVEDLQILGNLAPYPENYHYIIVEIPALLSGKYPLPLLRRFDLSLLVCRANRNWEQADQQALTTLQRVSRNPIRVVLNGADMNTLATFMGELDQPGKPLVMSPSNKQEPLSYDL
jgi:uncharacterized protein involved in exopolysaccharide biosynthesis